MTLSLPTDPNLGGVLKHYGSYFAKAAWTGLGNAGGFSGARLWRCETADERRWCLRHWPIARTTEDRLRTIHRAIRLMEPLSFVPKICPTGSGSTWIQFDDAFWELTSWMPGTADFHRKPSNARLFAAMRCLALMHERLRLAGSAVAPCPAVKRILRAMRGWRELLQSGWEPDFELPRPDPIPSIAHRAWNAIAVNTYSIEFALVDWETRPLPVQLCLCDIWHDHILYEREEVKGVIDYGAVKPDCVAIDLARLLGSMIPDQPERMHEALAIYSAIHAAPGDVLKLAEVLDRASAIVGLTNWLRWLYLEERSYSEAAGVANRMETLLKRVETQKPAAFCFG
jgi:hypothetical protein